MKICVPVAKDFGLDSSVYGHFGSAPCFLFVDTETGECQALERADDGHGHGHGGCSPLRMMAGRQVDALVVGGIGAGALQTLAAVGIPVFECLAGTVQDAVDALRNGSLKRFEFEARCGGGRHGHGGCH